MDAPVVGAGTTGRWVGEAVADADSVSFADADPDAAEAGAEATGGGDVAIDGGGQ
jgi:hypothetical protein